MTHDGHREDRIKPSLPVPLTSIVKQRRSGLRSCAKATTPLESRPPERKAPTGTSEMSCDGQPGEDDP